MVKIQDFTRIILDQRQDLPPTTDYSLPYLSYLPFIFQFSSKSRYQVQRPNISEDQSRHSLSRASIEVKSKSNNPKKKNWHRKNSNMISN
jgi:hypothetical protein